MMITKIKENQDVNFPKLGYVNIKVQIDEAAIRRGKIYSNPSTISDDMDDIQWLIGGIEITSNKYILLEIIPNRRTNTILEVFQRHLYLNTIIITDGYPSYPEAVRIFVSDHIIVPLNRGFINENGCHKNLIENLWSYMKAEYRIRRGIQVRNMEDFIFEFYL